MSTAHLSPGFRDEEQSHPNHWQLRHFHRGPCGLSPRGHHHTKPFWPRALGSTTHIPLSKVSGRICVHCQVGLPIPDHKCPQRPLSNDLVLPSTDSCPLRTCSRNLLPSPFPTRKLPGSSGRSDNGHRCASPGQRAPRPLKVGPPTSYSWPAEPQGGQAVPDATTPESGPSACRLFITDVLG